MERLIAAANCVRYVEIVKKPNKFQKFKSEFLSSYIENQFLSCLGRCFFFLFLIFPISFTVFFSKKKKLLSQRNRKISETGDAKAFVTLKHVTIFKFNSELEFEFQFLKKNAFDRKVPATGEEGVGAKIDLFFFSPGRE